MVENTNRLKSLLTKDNHPIWLSIGLHLIPGILATLFYIPLAKYFYDHNIPIVLALHTVLIFILIPFEYGLIKLLSKKKEEKPQNLGEQTRFPSIIKNTKENSTKSIILLSFLSLVWAILIMGVLDKQLGVSAWILENWFSWLPEYFDMAGVYNNPELYSTGILVLILTLTLIFGAILGPFIEEIYFRGFLMPRMAKNTWISPVLNTVLFALYHLWTPWMLPIRVLALLPMVILIWWKKDVKIGIYSHVALNLSGDVILVIPLFFF
ncbi:MAG: lysostaphin resistance A-like protein [Promethearchaeota archaeon]